MFQVCLHKYISTYTRICELLWTHCYVYNIDIVMDCFMIDCIFVYYITVNFHTQLQYYCVIQ